jgi:hypothetical protein
VGHQTRPDFVDQIDILQVKFAGVNTPCCNRNDWPIDKDSHTEEQGSLPPFRPRWEGPTHCRFVDIARPETSEFRFGAVGAAANSSVVPKLTACISSRPGTTKRLTEAVFDQVVTTLWQPLNLTAPGLSVHTVREFCGTIRSDGRAGKKNRFPVEQSGHESLSID